MAQSFRRLGWDAGSAANLLGDTQESARPGSLCFSGGWVCLLPDRGFNQTGVWFGRPDIFESFQLSPVTVGVEQPLLRLNLELIFAP